MQQAIADTNATRAQRRRRSRWARVKPRPYEPISRGAYISIALLSMALMFGLWSAASYGDWFGNPLFLPTPTQVWGALKTAANSGILWTDMRVSVTTIVLGFAISSAVAIPVGMLMGAFKHGEAFFEPPVDFIRYMPAVAFAPLTLIWFGVSQTQKLSLLFIGIFFQEVLLVMDNVKTVRRNLVDIAYTMGLRQDQVIRRVILRASLPGIVDTLRISMGWAWTYLVVAELVGANAGLGYRITVAQRYLDTATMIGYIIVIGILGLAFDFGFKAIYAWSFPYMAHRGRR
jgi:NitT/TauT family transport system permease protein